MTKKQLLDAIKDLPDNTEIVGYDQEFKDTYAVTSLALTAAGTEIVTARWRDGSPRHRRRYDTAQVVLGDWSRDMDEHETRIWSAR